MTTYSFGVPGYAVWTLHVVVGAFLLYLGYLLYNHKQVNQSIVIGLIILGVLVMLYHAHLFYYHTFTKDGANMLPSQ